MSFSAADQEFEAWRLTQGHDSPQPWGRKADDLLRTAELAEAMAATLAAKSVADGSDQQDRLVARAIHQRAAALVDGLHRRRARGEVTPAEFRRACVVLERVQTQRISRNELAASLRRRAELLERRRAEAEAELEEAGSVAEMVEHLVTALWAESQRAAGHWRRLKSVEAHAWAYSAACRIGNRVADALDGWHANRAAGTAVTNGEWRAGVDVLAEARRDLDELEARLRIRSAP